MHTWGLMSEGFSGEFSLCDTRNFSLHNGVCKIYNSVHFAFQSYLPMSQRLFTPDLARSAGLDENRFPNSEEEANLAEQVLSSELQKLSLDEHERILFEIHGIRCTAEEESESFLSEKLVQLEAYLGNIKRKKKGAYDQARFLNKKYVDSPDFRVAFLRSDKFNVKLAAQTIINHFEIKRRIFGEGEILGRDVLQTDLTDEDMERLRDGFIQVLPERDAAGRTVICLNLGFRRQDSLASPLVG